MTLELGFAMAIGDQWFIAIDPSKTDVNEVPSDLRGLDRIQYSSYTELSTNLAVLLEQHYPKKARGTLDSYLEDRRSEIRDILRSNPGLTIISLAQLLRVEVPVAQLALRPLFETGELESTGNRKGMKYFIKGTRPG